MRLVWFLTYFLWRVRQLCHAADTDPEIEKYHYPGFYTSTPTPYINGTDTQIVSTQYTPDYRVEEKMYVVYSTFKKERERPYRLSPHYKQTYYWYKTDEAFMLACYCCTVYKRYDVLAGCALITTRHILTTATTTDLILRSYGEMYILEDILGAWYETDENLYNVSQYAAPSRIHIHPLYKYDYEVNLTHPIPCMYDLSVWASTYKFSGNFYTFSGAVICSRAASGWFEYSSSIPRQFDLSIVVGYLFIKAHKRRPLPWFKYGVKTKSYLWPCPKSDWHWFHCIQGEYWGRFGFDSGGAMHLCTEKKDYRVSGMAGMCAFSLKLRSKQTTHYFTVVDTYLVLDFMYDAYLGLIPPVWLDDRFEDTKWAAPMAWFDVHITDTYPAAEEINFNPPFYRR